MSPRPLVLMVEQVLEVMRSSLRSAETVKGLRPLRGSRGEPLTAGPPLPTVAVITIARNRRS
jgi:hypothetical protein